MTKQIEVYKCFICGNIIEVLKKGSGKIVCCNKTMALLEENTHDAANEKHIPVIEETNDGYKVSIGSVPHPMEEKHYIEWIELTVDNKVYKQFLHPNEPPEAFFPIKGKNVFSRGYCNLHELWKN